MLPEPSPAEDPQPEQSQPADSTTPPAPDTPPTDGPVTDAPAAPAPGADPAGEAEAVDEDDDDDDDDEDETAEDLAEYAEFSRLDPEFDHRRKILRKSLDLIEEREDRRRRRNRPAIDWSKSEAERELAEKQQYTEWEAEGREWFLQQHAAGVFNEWLAQYTVTSYDSIDRFAKGYGTAYADYRAYGASFQRWLDEQKLQYREAADKLLWQIQQKKLFDLQCRWRAGQIQLPGVEVVEEFRYWHDRLHRCSFLAPITDDEFACYLAYAQSAAFDEDERCDQDYDTYKKEHQGDTGTVTMPEWYQFHNAYTGNGALLLLPDVRGEREDHYREAYLDYWRAKRAAEKAAAPAEPTPAPKDPRPPLRWRSWGGGEREAATYDFLRRFAEPGVLQHLKAVNSTSMDDRAELTEAFELLLEIREPVRMEAHPNWREALKLTAERYRREQIVAALAASYEDYKLRAQLGLAHQPYCKYPDVLAASLLVEKLDILKGRILCGEPANFDY